MPRKFKFCLQCRRTIAENEIQRGLFVQTLHGMLCATCAQRLDEETEAAKQLAATQAPVPAPPAEPPKEEPAPRPSLIPQVSVHEEPPAGVPTPIAPDPPDAPVSPPTPADAPSAGPQSSGREPAAQLLDGIREHLEAIHRTLVFEKSSPWNVFATVAQCLAVGMLILGAINWADNPMHLLLVALIFQVMALTFFVRGK